MATLLVGSLVVVIVRKQRAITNRFELRRRELESPRAKLVDDENEQQSMTRLRSVSIFATART